MQHDTSYEDIDKKEHASIKAIDRSKLFDSRVDYSSRMIMGASNCLHLKSSLMKKRSNITLNSGNKY